MADSMSGFGEIGGVAKVDYDMKRKTSISSNESKVFEVFFLVNDDDQSVWVMETPEIDLGDVISWLKQGDSVFIHCACTKRNGVIE